MDIFHQRIELAKALNIKMGFYKFILFFVLPLRFVYSIYVAIQSVSLIVVDSLFWIDFLACLLGLGLLVWLFFSLLLFKNNAFIVLLVYVVFDFCLVCLTYATTSIAQFFIIYIITVIYFWKRKVLFKQNLRKPPVNDHQHSQNDRSGVITFVPPAVSSGKTNDVHISADYPQPIGFCAQCGNKLSFDSIFCDKCGTKVQ